MAARGRRRRNPSWRSECVLFLLFFLVLAASRDIAVGVRANAAAERRKEMDQMLQAQVDKMLATFEKDADVASLTQQQTSCSCYHIRNDYCCHQYMCICSPMCWNGYELISLGQPKCAPAAEHTAPPPGQDPILSPVDCTHQREFTSALSDIVSITAEARLAERSAGGRGGGRGDGGEGWLGSRREVDWQFGLTMLQRFNDSSVNLSHFAEKALTLLLANNFTAPALLRPMVTRFMLPREELVLEKMRMKGGEAVHARLLQAMIEFAVTPVLSPRIHMSRQLHDHRTLGDAPMAFGLVEFESAWNAATEARPLCFERLLLPGVLKGQAFPSHPTQGTFLDRHLRAKLGLDPPGKVEWGRDGVRGWRPRVLYITRLGAELKLRRTFLPESHEALLKLMEELGLQVTMVEMGQLTFRQQFEAIQSADIVISLHGAALTNVALFARRTTALIEVMPYGVVHELYYSLSLNSGIPYFLKMCRKGEAQEGDLAEFEGLSYKECMHKNLACKWHHIHIRRIELTDRDLMDLKKMLLVAKDIVGAKLGGFGRDLQSGELPGWAVERFGGMCVARDVDFDHDCGAGFSLYKNVDLPKVRALNEAVEGSAEGVFRSWEDRMTFPSQPMDSNEDDPELILFIPFTTDVKIKSIAIIGGADGTSPAKMRAFINREDVDFSVVNDLTAVQEWDLTEDLQGELEYTTKFSKFQGVSSLTLHFPSNFGGDFSRIHFVGLKGEATQNNRRAVAAVVYEAQANPSDHDPVFHRTSGTSQTQGLAWSTRMCSTALTMPS
ncbi:unnamed protein product [Closterium sp. Naga37s-1]|nr:unnamed protein product [Closterium sp. Naga37s-1]